MKNLGTELLRPDAHREIAMGNVALVRAMVEAGVKVVTSYPGSPTPEIAEAIHAMPPGKRPFYFEFSTNEKVATEVAFGAAVDGKLSVVFFKSVGLNVAADSFVQLPLMDISGGMVIILGDDPGANSSQNEQDNRHYALMSYMPVLEPASAQEAYDMFKVACSLARGRRMPVILRLTTHVCHAKELIEFEALPANPRQDASSFDPDASNFVPIAAAVFPLKRRALERLDALRTFANTSALNVMIPGEDHTRGIITAGAPYLSLRDVFETVHPMPDILKLGVIHPLPADVIGKFLEAHKEVKILEELDPVLETGIKALAYETRQTTRIIGKLDYEEWIGEYTPDKVRAVMAACWPDLVEQLPRRPALPHKNPARPPQLCPGCGHRSAFHAIKQALKSEDITVADIGCHSLGYLPPYRMGRVLLSMGHATATASGLALSHKTGRIVCFMGDSTFFHAGLPGIVNAVFNRHDVLLIILENGTTAMTGHQDHPAVGRNFNGETMKIPVRQTLEGLGVGNIREVDTYKQAELTALVKEALGETGFRVIIARHPCMLKLMKEARKKPGWKAQHVMVDPKLCTKNKTCVASFACPSFQLRADGSAHVQNDLCIGDGSCRQTCPSLAIVPEGTERKQP